METIVGLPTHPLVVHAAVVLLPLAALGGVLMGFSARFAVRFGPLVVCVAGVAALSAGAARLTGEELAETVPAPEAHVQAGNLLPLAALVYFALLLTLWLLDRRTARALGTQILAVIVIAAAIILTGWAIRAGHTGAEAVWQGIGQQLSGS